MLTADQLVDLGLKPEDITPGGTIAMADPQEPKARYPQQEVNEGQKHGYIGEDVEVYDEATGKKVGKGVKPSVATSGVDEAGAGSTEIVGTMGTIKADDTADDEAPSQGRKSR